MKRLFSAHLRLLCIQAIAVAIILILGLRPILINFIYALLSASVSYIILSAVASWQLNSEKFDSEDIFVGSASTLIFAIISLVHLIAVEIMGWQFVFVIIILALILLWLLNFTSRIISIDTGVERSICMLAQTPIVGLVVSKFSL